MMELDRDLNPIYSREERAEIREWLAWGQLHSYFFAPLRCRLGWHQRSVRVWSVADRGVDYCKHCQRTWLTGRWQPGDLLSEEELELVMEAAEDPMPGHPPLR